MLNLIRRYSTLYLVEIIGFYLMGNHFHILARMFPDNKFTDEDIKKRYEAFYGDKRLLADGKSRLYARNYPTFLNLCVK